MRRSAIGYAALVLLSTGCGHAPPASFVTLQNGVFMENGRPFYPLAINYIAHLEADDSSCWAAPLFDTDHTNRMRPDTRDSALALIKAEFELVRKMGFNTVRVVGIASDLVMKNGTKDLYLHMRQRSGEDSLFALNGSRSEEYLKAVEDLVKLAEESGLKLILLVRLIPGEPAYELQMTKLADRLCDHDGILAYDFFNEPLYFDVHDRPKREVHEIVKRWQRLLTAHAPHQLTTIGLVGVPEVFAWDPNVLDVDFISFHPYEYEPEQVRNEMRWYGEHVDKPWIIGETSLPADNDSVNYADQLAFARKTLSQAKACGAIGYSWWQFKDVGWGRFHSDYMGVLNRQGETSVSDELPLVQGTVKPVAEAFLEFDPKKPEGPCVHLPNYYNFSSRSSATITGRLLDEQGKPIEGGVVIGWNAGWSASYYTFSKPDGTFALYSDFPFHHWMASATRYSMVRGDAQPNSYYSDGGGTPTFFLGDLQLDHVDYADPKP